MLSDVLCDRTTRVEALVSAKVDELKALMRELVGERATKQSIHDKLDTMNEVLSGMEKPWCPKLILKQHFFVRGSDVTIRPILAAFGRLCDVAFHPRFHSAVFHNSFS